MKPEPSAVALCLRVRSSCFVLLHEIFEEIFERRAGRELQFGRHSLHSSFVGVDGLDGRDVDDGGQQLFRQIGKTGGPLRANAGSEAVNKTRIRTSWVRKRGRMFESKTSGKGFG